MIHSFSSLLGNLDIGFVLVFLDWLQKNRCAFWTEKLRQRKIQIYHMGFTFYIAVGLSPWLFFLSCKITIFSVGATACNSDFSETPCQIKHIKWDKHSLCFGGYFPHASVSFYWGSYITLTNWVFQYINLIVGWDKGK